ncbi:MAG: hypothetical protein BAJALOKI3v1_690013 [Promethearchaeota archaeon]|nr:MAG: hypothetical protein BAJALOKI3v1_690013 [Candidatus Lokiarchaeota archaeon]
MDFEDKISEIKTEIQKKEGKEWLGLQSTTEHQLESLVWYLDHPKITEYPKLLEEVINLYFKARESSFIKMEGIIRKLDQLQIKLGKHDYEKEDEPKKELKFINYPKKIKDMKVKIELMLQSPYGTSLPESTTESLITLINYLNHPNLPTNKRLFDEIYEVYEQAKADDFLKMQAFKDMLNKIEIKLGSLSEDMKQFKTLEEKQADLEKEKEIVKEKERELEELKERYMKKKADLEIEQQNLEVERKKIEEVQKGLREKEEKLELEKKGLEQERVNIEKEKETINEERKELQEKWELIKSFEEKIEKFNELEPNQ